MDLFSRRCIERSLKDDRHVREYVFVLILHALKKPNLAKADNQKNIKLRGMQRGIRYLRPYTYFSWGDFQVQNKRGERFEVSVFSADHWLARLLGLW